MGLFGRKKQDQGQEDSPYLSDDPAEQFALDIAQLDEAAQSGALDKDEIDDTRRRIIDAALADGVISAEEAAEQRARGGLV